MNRIGSTNNREIYYLHCRDYLQWKKLLPQSNWLALVLADNGDKERISIVVDNCLDHNVVYVCGVGKLAHLIEEHFDEEIVHRAAEHEINTGIECDYDRTPITTAHSSLGEGLWFATHVAHDACEEIIWVVCVNLSRENLQAQISCLLDKYSQETDASQITTE